jgi:four helix bundle protein
MEECRYRKLIVWQKAHQNALTVIDLIKDSQQKYERIISQCIGSATSIGANIAEGNNSGLKQKLAYFRVALNSAYEFDDCK